MTIKTIKKGEAVKASSTRSNNSNKEIYASINELMKKVGSKLQATNDPKYQALLEDIAVIACEVKGMNIDE